MQRLAKGGGDPAPLAEAVSEPPPERPQRSAGNLTDEIAALRRHGMADDDGGEVGCIVGQGGGRQPNHGNGGNTCNSHRNLHRTKGWDVVGHT